MDKFDQNMDLSSLPKQNLWGDNYLLQLGGFWFVPQIVKPIQRVINHFNPLPTDVILATSPKSGTTWLKSLVFCILSRSSKHKLAIENPHDLVPFLEVQVFADSDEPPILSAPSDARRLFATHIPYQLLAKTLDSCECKVIYLTRNPKDTLVSMWHFVNRWNKENPDQSWSLDEATDKFCHGISLNGPYYDHVIGYRELSLKRPENVMFVTFEEMMEDPHGYVKKLGDFLGCPFEDEDDEVEEIVKKCSIGALSNHDVNKSEESPAWFPVPYNSFFRNGTVGDHKNYLSEEAIQHIDALTYERFHSLGFMYGI